MRVQVQTRNGFQPQQTSSLKSMMAVNHDKGLCFVAKALRNLNRFPIVRISTVNQILHIIHIKLSLTNPNLANRYRVEISHVGYSFRYSMPTSASSSAIQSSAKVSCSSSGGTDSRVYVSPSSW